MGFIKKEYPAIVLAGGLGTRLKPITETIPKPMVLINGKPFLEYKLEALKKYGIKDIILCIGYLGEKIELSALFSFHESLKPLITIAVTNASNPLEQELIDIKEDLIKFYVRDTFEHNEYLKTKQKFLITAGTYIFDRKVLDLIPKK